MTPDVATRGKHVRRTPAAWLVAVAGMCGGALLALGSISLGGFVILLPAAAVVLGVTFWAARLAAVPWVVLGMALVPLWVAFTNRGGPGMRCDATPDGEACHELHDPGPWLTAGVAVLGFAALAFAVVSLMGRRRPA